METQLNLDDIKNAIECIDHAQEQGAYKGWETVIKVLEIRNRLSSFVQSAIPNVQEETDNANNQEIDTSSSDMVI